MGTIITSRESSRDVSAAKRAAEHGPVTVTDHGRSSHVLLTAEEFERLAGKQELMGSRLWDGQDPGITVDLPERRVEPEREIERCNTFSTPTS